jgi:hypothetical protein
LLQAAGREDDSAYDIENVDAQGLKNRGQVLLSIYEFGTGHCMTVYAIDTRTPSYRKIWEASGAKLSNFCTASILGAATASVGPEGTIVVKLPVPKEGLPLSKLNSELLLQTTCGLGRRTACAPRKNSPATSGTAKIGYFVVSRSGRRLSFDGHSVDTD